MRRYFIIITLFIYSISYHSEIYAQILDPLDNYIRVDSIGLNDHVADPYSQFNELNAEMGMFETKTPINNYLGITLEKSHLVILDHVIINLVFQPKKELLVKDIMKILKKTLHLKGVKMQDNKKRVTWTSAHYIIEYNYSETAKRIYVYENRRMQ